MSYAAAIAAASAANPMGGVSVPVVPNRVLLVDGDGLAYYCAGNDETDAGEARQRLVDKVKGAARRVGAEHIIVLLTLSGSHKGHRYAIARVKPYQGQRSDSKRPKNWQPLRDYMTGTDFPFAVKGTLIAEADDLFGWYAYNQPDNVVIYTQDKDMRMLPGWHLDWVSHRTHRVDYSLSAERDKYRMFNVVVHDSEFNDKQYGPKWFWLQMLHGDTADNIPGLPRYKVYSPDKPKPVGEVTAGKMLDGWAFPQGEYRKEVAHWYATNYGDRWLVEMLEQACLLWMRRDPSAWDDCLNEGGPMYPFNDGSPEFIKAYAEIAHRVATAQAINDATTQGN